MAEYKKISDSVLEATTKHRIDKFSILEQINCLTAEQSSTSKQIEELNRQLAILSAP